LRRAGSSLTEHVEGDARRDIAMREMTGQCTAGLAKRPYWRIETLCRGKSTAGDKRSPRATNRIRSSEIRERTRRRMSSILGGIYEGVSADRPRPAYKSYAITGPAPSSPVCAPLVARPGLSPPGPTLSGKKKEKKKNNGEQQRGKCDRPQECSSPPNKKKNGTSVRKSAVLWARVQARSGDQDGLAARAIAQLSPEQEYPAAIHNQRLP